MRRIIAILAGGYSSEHDVSMRSAMGIYSFIDQEKYECYIVEVSANGWEAYVESAKMPVNRDNFTFTTVHGTVRPDFVYITIHGNPGENGLVQGYLDLLKIPYSTSGVLVEALTFNKFALNRFIKSFDVNVSESLLVRKGKEYEISNQEIVEKIGIPCFIKPNAGGSSFGVSKVKSEEDIRPAIEKALSESDEVMVESLMVGTEVTCGCYKTKFGSAVFPITEVVTHNEFFDYDAKYNGQVEEITPARIEDSTAKRVSDLTSRIYDILDCEGIIRIDYILSGERGKEEINMLEINTTPGMTATSFVPQQIRAAGLDIKDVMTNIIENKLVK